MRNLSKLLVLAIGSLANSASVWAACGLSIAANPISINWDTSFATQGISFTLTKTDAGTCDYFVGFTKGGAASAATRRAISGANQITYQLYKENALTNVLKDPSDAAITSSNEVFSGQLPAGVGAQLTLVYYFNVPLSSSITPSIVKAGTYTDTFTINVYEGADPLVPGPTPVTSANVAVTVTVPEILKMSLVATGAGFDEAGLNRSIDFGMLSAGQTRTFDIRIRTNAGFDVTFSSANNGVLKPVANPASTGLAYQFYANGVLLNLTNSLAVPVRGLGGPGVGNFETDLQGVAYPIRIVVGSFAGASVLGGEAQDTITITTTTL